MPSLTYSEPSGSDRFLSAYLKNKFFKCTHLQILYDAYRKYVYQYTYEKLYILTICGGKRGFQKKVIKNLVWYVDHFFRPRTSIVNESGLWTTFFDQEWTWSKEPHLPTMNECVLNPGIWTIYFDHGLSWSKNLIYELCF